VPRTGGVVLLGVAGGVNLLLRPLGYPQGIGDLMLLPTLLVQFPGPQAATLPPIGGLA
jgi:hypothetical protein